MLGVGRSRQNTRRPKKGSGCIWQSYPGSAATSKPSSASPSLARMILNPRSGGVFYREAVPFGARHTDTNFVPNSFNISSRWASAGKASAPLLCPLAPYGRLRALHLHAVRLDRRRCVHHSTRELANTLG
jgi:hypothetical protein